MLTNYKDYINPLMLKFCECVNKNNYSNITNEEIKDIKIFLLYMIVCMTNNKFNSAINNTKDYRNKCFDKIKITDSNNSIYTNKEKIIEIRNIFVHKSGVITLNYSDNQLKFSNNYNNGNKNIDYISKDDLIACLSRSVDNYRGNTENKFSIIFDTIDTLDSLNSKEKIINEDIITLIKLFLILSYNKESILDTYLIKQQGQIDCSKFSVETKSSFRRKLISNFIEKYAFLFLTSKDNQTFLNEHSSEYSSLNLSNKEKYLYSINNCPIDKSTNEHFPINILMIKLRNSMSHGFFEIVGDNFIFYDKNNPNSTEAITITIKKQDLEQFLINPIFNEMLTTKIPNLVERQKNQLFNFERADSGIDFNNLVHIYQYRYNLNTKIDAVDKMLESATLSSYILEFPENIDKVLNYKLENGESVLTHLEKKYNMRLSHYNNSNYPYEKIMWDRKYNETIKLCKQAFFTKGGNLKFWVAYFTYLYNRYRNDKKFISRQFFEKIEETDTNQYFFDMYKIGACAKELQEKFGKDKLMYKLILNDPIIIMQVMSVIYCDDNKTEMFFNIVATIKNGLQNSLVQSEEQRTLNANNIIEYNSENRLLKVFSSRRVEQIKERIDKLARKGENIIRACSNIKRLKKIINESYESGIYDDDIISYILNINSSSAAILISCQYGYNMLNEMLSQIEETIKDKSEDENKKREKIEQEYAPIGDFGDKII